MVTAIFDGDAYKDYLQDAFGANLINDAQGFDELAGPQCDGIEVSVCEVKGFCSP